MNSYPTITASPGWQTPVLTSAILTELITQPLQQLIAELSAWPTLADYQQWLIHTTGAITSAHGAPLRFVPQSGKPDHFEQRYASRIYLHGEVQTRLNCWHDFFQVICWCLYPNIKRTLNAQHFIASKQHADANHSKGSRSKPENAMSLFDECGAIIVCSNPALLEMVRNFAWKDLFWRNRTAFEHEIRCFMFGHALMQKVLNPYVGITANCLLLEVPQSFFRSTHAQQLAQLDLQMAGKMQSENLLPNPRALSPLPLLGVPKWWPDNTDAAFYDNVDYFRPGRSQRS